jgi:hypothetical protein
MEEMSVWLKLFQRCISCMAGEKPPSRQERIIEAHHQVGERHHLL